MTTPEEFHYVEYCNEHLKVLRTCHCMVLFKDRTPVLVDCRPQCLDHGKDPILVMEPEHFSIFKRVYVISNRTLEPDTPKFPVIKGQVVLMIRDGNRIRVKATMVTDTTIHLRNI